MTPVTGEQRRDLLEIVDDRHERGSTIVISQVPVDHWHEVIGGPTIADAVLDRLGIDIPMEAPHRAAAASQRARASSDVSCAPRTVTKTPDTHRNHEQCLI